MYRWRWEAYKALGDEEKTIAALKDLEDAGISVYDVGMRRPTLDDVFLTLTGSPVEAEEVPV